MAVQEVAFGAVTHVAHRPPSVPRVHHSRKKLIAFGNALSAALLKRFFDEEVSIIHVPSFYPAETCAALAQWLYTHPERAVYGQNAVDPKTGKTAYYDYLVDRVGEPRNKFIGKGMDDPEWRTYFAKGAELERQIDQVTHGLHPVRLLINRLRAVWPEGACNEMLHGQASPAGIGRITRPAQSGIDHPMERPHVDGPWPCQLHFSVNVYLEMPGAGGELETFQGPTLTAEQMRQVPVDHDFRESHPVSESIRPHVGDLVFINTRRPHAVSAFSQGTRVSFASFGKYDPGQPLRFYS